MFVGNNRSSSELPRLSWVLCGILTRTRRQTFPSHMPLNFPIYPVAVDYIRWYQHAAPDKLSSQFGLFFPRMQTEPLNGCMITLILSNWPNRYNSFCIHYPAPHISFMLLLLLCLPTRQHLKVIRTASRGWIGETKGRDGRWFSYSSTFLQVDSKLDFIPMSTFHFTISTFAWKRLRDPQWFNWMSLLSMRNVSAALVNLTKYSNIAKQTVLPQQTLTEKIGIEPPTCQTTNSTSNWLLINLSVLKWESVNVVIVIWYQMQFVPLLQPWLVVRKSK